MVVVVEVEVVRIVIVVLVVRGRSRSRSGCNPRTSMSSSSGSSGYGSTHACIRELVATGIASHRWLGDTPGNAGSWGNLAEVGTGPAPRSTRGFDCSSA